MLLQQASRNVLPRALLGGSVDLVSSDSIRLLSIITPVKIPFRVPKGVCLAHPKRFLGEHLGTDYLHPEFPSPRTLKPLTHATWSHVQTFEYPVMKEYALKYRIAIMR